MDVMRIIYVVEMVFASLGVILVFLFGLEMLSKNRDKRIAILGSACVFCVVVGIVLELISRFVG